MKEDISCEFHLYYLQIFIVFVDYNERNDLLEPVNPNAEQVPIRRETVRSLMDSMGKSNQTLLNEYEGFVGHFKRWLSENCSKCHL